MLWLLPCAIQDRRTRHVSNWLTVPLFLLAWPCSLALHTAPLTLATFAGFWFAFCVGAGGIGGADGKIATGVAALAPAALVAGIVISGLAFGVLHLRGERSPRLPGAVCLYLGVVLTFLAFAALAWRAQPAGHL
jgi:Flp pilus assembly protein protease CpaA